MLPISLDFESVRDQLKVRKKSEKVEIWDIIRKKWIVLQPEEWVRQNLVHMLLCKYSVSKNRIAIEKSFTINNKSKRFDLVLFNKFSEPHILIECKAANIPISQDVFDQVGTYNLHIKAPYLIVSNGILTYCCKQNHAAKDFTFLDDIPIPSRQE
jgi:hypothetical protein